MGQFVLFPLMRNRGMKHLPLVASRSQDRNEKQRQYRLALNFVI